MRTLWELYDNHLNHLEPLKTTENHWKLLKTNENHWKQVIKKNHSEQMRATGNNWKPMKTTENHWEQTILLEPLGTIQNRLLSSSQWFSMILIGSQ